jgi:WS/DGAT/MGAT family acyltransferase
MGSITPLSELDELLLAAETPSQHLHVVATLVLDTTGLGDVFPLFQARIRERYRMVEPLRRRLQRTPLGGHVWVDDPDLHLASHLRHVHLDGGGLDAVAEVASSVASEPLRRDRPLWEAWLVEGFAPDRAAVIAKVHHAAVDGVSGFDALAAFFDLEPDPETVIWPDTWEPAPAPPPADVARHAVASALARPAVAARSAQRLVSSLAAALRQSDARAPLPLTAPRVSFNRALRPSRRLAFTSVALDDVKSVRRAFDATVNDVVVALVTGALRRYLLERDELPDRALVAAVPTSERLPEHGPSGNRFSAMFYALPVHVADPAARIDEVKRSAEAAKDLYAAATTGALGAAAGVLPPTLASGIMRAASALRVADVVPPLANVIVSNIRGPEFPLYIGGSSVEQIFPMGPLVEGTGLGVTVVSYRDRIGMGFLACPELLPDVHDLVTAATDELAELVTAAAAS